MILFREDWKEYPTAIVDYNTSNQSFKHLVYVYNQMGIKNCEFILALLQPDLVGVDPHDPELSREMKLKISLECKYNPWYFFREVALAPANSGSKPRRFEANRGNIALYWSFFNHIDFGLLQPRQTGKSYSVDILMTALRDIWAENTELQLITKDAPLKNKNIGRLKKIRELLPEYIYYPNRSDVDNTEMMTNLRLGNTYKTAVARNDKIAADKLGRGLTVPVIQFDEFGYLNLIELTLPVALSSGNAARAEAREAGQLYGNLFTTTAASVNTRDGEYAYQFMTGGAIWDESYFDLSNEAELRKVIKKGATGKKILIYGAFNHRQLGKSDEWLYEALLENNSYGEIADRDFMNIWTTGNEGSPLSPEEKEAVRGSEREVKYMEITNEGYGLRWFIPRDQIESRMESGRFVLGLDTSDALGGDNDAIGMVLLDTVSHDVIMTGRFNETNLTQFALFLVELLVKYTSITLVPERKSSCMAILDTMFIHLPLRGVDPFKRIYNMLMDDPEKNKTEYQEVHRTPLSSRPTYFYDRYKRYFGFVTSGAGRHSRDALYGDALKSTLRLGAKRMHDKILINELLTLTMRNGRIDHSKGNHDDMVVSLLLAHWFCTKGRNLDSYGIDALRVFSAADSNEEELTPKERYNRNLRHDYQDQFHSILEELKTIEDPFLISRMEVKLRQLSTQFDTHEAMGEGIDAMIKQAQEERTRKTKVKRHGSRYGAKGWKTIA